MILTTVFLVACSEDPWIRPSTATSAATATATRMVTSPVDLPRGRYLLEWTADEGAVRRSDLEALRQAGLQVLALLDGRRVLVQPRDGEEGPFSLDSRFSATRFETVLRKPVEELLDPANTGFFELSVQVLPPVSTTSGWRTPVPAVLPDGFSGRWPGPEKSADVVSGKLDFLSGPYNPAWPTVDVRTDREGLERLLRDPEVVFVEPRARVVPADLAVLEAVGVPVTTPPALGLTGAGQRLHVVDSGIDPTHRAFGPRGAVTTVDASGDGTQEAFAGHGTHVASIAVGGNFATEGVAGVAPEADLVVTALESKGCVARNRSCSSWNVTDLVARLTLSPGAVAHVHNLSLDVSEGPTYGTSPAALDAYAVSHPLELLVVAAGNNYPLELLVGAAGNNYPQPEPVQGLGATINTVTVGAVGSPRTSSTPWYGPNSPTSSPWGTGNLAPFSERGASSGRAHPTLVAPGVGVLGARASGFVTLGPARPVSVTTPSTGEPCERSSGAGMASSWTTTSLSAGRPHYLQVTTDMADPASSASSVCGRCKVPGVIDHWYQTFRWSGDVSAGPAQFVGAVGDEAVTANLPSGKVVTCEAFVQNGNNTLLSLVAGPGPGRQGVDPSSLGLRSLDDAYTGKTGTSMAAPVVSGVALLLRQHLVDSGHPTPSANLLKALLMLGATRPSGAPYGGLGWGLPDLAGTLPPDGGRSLLLADEQVGFVPPTDPNVDPPDQCWTLYVRSGGSAIDVALAWNDMPPAGSARVVPALTQDLDLVLTPPASSGAAVSRGSDRRTNAERITVSAAPAGSWELCVTAHTIHQSSPFALAVHAAPGSALTKN